MKLIFDALRADRNRTLSLSLSFFHQCITNSCWPAADYAQTPPSSICRGFVVQQAVQGVYTKIESHTTNQRYLGASCKTTTCTTCCPTSAQQIQVVECRLQVRSSSSCLHQQGEWAYITPHSFLPLSRCPFDIYFFPCTITNYNVD